MPPVVPQVLQENEVVVSAVPEQSEVEYSVRVVTPSLTSHFSEDKAPAAPLARHPVALTSSACTLSTALAQEPKYICSLTFVAGSGPHLNIFPLLSQLPTELDKT